MTPELTLARQGVTEATLRAARRMGLSRLFLQVVAQEMPDGALVGLRVEESAAGVVARAMHVCDAGCDLAAERCLTALKLQALLGRERKAPFAVAHVAREGDALQVRLVPLARLA
ncbi:MAG TPA: hypothetical protein VHI93_05970 [Candidatus Thermoplasmatota archaeon]|nr:hypothetical protein [Candidatus Thermoplasmatota archaeon]